MNVTELTKEVSDTLGTNDLAASAAVSAVVGSIAAAMTRGEDVAIFGFGKFSVKERAASKGRNPRTGEPMDVKASKKVVFTTSKRLKDKL